MRRLFVAATMFAVILLLSGLCAVAALATTHKVGGASSGAFTTMRALRRTGASWAYAHPRFVPAPEAIGAIAAINGTLRDYSGVGLGSARVDWFVGSASSGHGTTDASGQYSFANAIAATGNGEITALSNDKNTWYDWWRISWPSPGPTTFDMRPGGVNTNGNQSGPWGSSATSITTDIFTSAGSERKEASEYFEGSLNALAPALPGTIDGIGVYFFAAEGAEATELNGLTVTAGATLTESASVDEVSAQRVWTGGGNVDLSKPWASGRPGSRLRVWLQNFPTNWTNHISGYSGNPSHSAKKEFGNFRSLGTDPHSRTLTVPAKAVPGYSYRLWVEHTTGPLQLQTFFQVCTLKSSKTTISKSGLIRLSGVVPVQDHVGSTAGTRTKVYCYWHKGTAAQPTTFTPGKQGWHYVGYVNSNGYGAYHTPLIKPGISMTFVMAYPGDEWYNAAYTSPIKITVR